MNKSEVSVVMHQILHELGDSVIISAVSLDYSNPKTPQSQENCQIRIKCDLDDCSLKRIQPILDKLKLKIEITEGNAVIY